MLLTPEEALSLLFGAGQVAHRYFIRGTCCGWKTRSMGALRVAHYTWSFDTFFDIKILIGAALVKMKIFPNHYQVPKSKT